MTGFWKSYFFLMLIVVLHPQDSMAKEYLYPSGKAVEYDAETQESQIKDLSIYATTDNKAMKPLIEDFQNKYPMITVFYHELQSLELYNRIIADDKAHRGSADIAISSAMDLQMKLANDGFVHRADILIKNGSPKWSIWRNEVFGTTLEPSVIVYNKPYFSDKKVPTNRSDLITFLESHPIGLYGKVGTYDIEKSGLGYMFLTRDDSQYSGIWDLVRALGQNGVKLYSQSSKIIKDVSLGQLKLGYNVLGTYAISQVIDNPDLGVILPEDYTTVISRLAIIPKAAHSYEAGILFLEYLLSERGQTQISQGANLNAIHPNVQSPFKMLNSLKEDNSSLRPIKVGPGLLVYLDKLKRDKIIQRWRKMLLVQ